MKSFHVQVPGQFILISFNYLQIHGVFWWEVAGYSVVWRIGPLLVAGYSDRAWRSGYFCSLPRFNGIGAGRILQKSIWYLLLTNFPVGLGVFPVQVFSYSFCR